MKPKVNELAFNCEICEHAAECDILEAQADEWEPHHAGRSRPFKIDCKLGIPPEFIMNAEPEEECEAPCIGEFLDEIATDLKHIRMSLEQANESLNAIIQTIDK